MLRRRAGGGVADQLWLPDDLGRALEAEAGECSPRETGGMLAGYATDKAVVVTQVIHGGPHAIRKPGRFEPDGAWQQQKLERIYSNSGRIETYLGDWHSHPQGVAEPSHRDRKTAALVARDPHARCRNPVTLLVASSSRGVWEMAAFLYVGRWRFRRLKLYVY